MSDRYKLKWKIKDWVAKKRGLYPFYSFYYKPRLDYAEAKRKFDAGELTGGWEAVLTPDDIPEDYPPHAEIRRHVEPILPPWLD